MSTTRKKREHYKKNVKSILKFMNANSEYFYHDLVNYALHTNQKWFDVLSSPNFIIFFNTYQNSIKEKELFLDNLIEDYERCSEYKRKY